MQTISFPLETFCSTRNKRNLSLRFIIRIILRKLVAAASLVQAIKAWNAAGLDLFCRDTASIQGLSLLFFFSVSLAISQTKTSI